MMLMQITAQKLESMTNGLHKVHESSLSTSGSATSVVLTVSFLDNPNNVSLAYGLVSIVSKKYGIFVGSSVTDSSGMASFGESIYSTWSNHKKCRVIYVILRKEAF